MVSVSIKATVNLDILIDLIYFDQFPGVDSIEKLNDEILDSNAEPDWGDPNQVIHSTIM